MTFEIKIPSVGESIQEAFLAEWFKEDGDTVARDDPLLAIETDKVALEVAAETSGILKILIPAGETVRIGAVVGSIEPDGAPVALAAVADPEAKPATADVPPPAPPEPAKAPVAAPPASPPTAPVASPPALAAASDRPGLSPSVRRLVAEKKLDVDKISGSGPGGRISKGDVLLYLENAPAGIPEKRPAPPAPDAAVDLEVRKPMTPIRKRIAQRLLEAKQKTALLTTFNEIDMSRVMALRSSYKESFLKAHGVSLGFMSFFIKACVAALEEIPELNAFIDGDDIVYHHYYHIGVAIGTKRGLVVPVIRHAEKMGFAAMEQAIIDYVAKIKENRLELADLEGGTFTVSNGGVYGSLLSTPLLNMPQSGILGMHKIEKRPVVIDDQIVIRPMMYVALSYDHRIVDGGEAVTFLKRVKEFVENPERIFLEV